MSEHSPIPWTLVEEDGDEWYFRNTQIVIKSPTSIVAVTGPKERPNAEFIVRAVNNHEALIEALEAVKAICQQNVMSAGPAHDVLRNIWPIIHGALKAARGEA